MSLGSRIYTVLTGAAAVTALIDTDIYPIQAPQGTEMPYVVWQKVSSDPIATHGEQSSEADSFNRVQFTAFASTFEALEELCAALVAALDGVAVLTNHPAVYDGEQDLSSDAPGVYARAVDFTF